MLLQANLLMARGDYAGAADVLNAHAEQQRRGARYARYNLGVALVRSGDCARGSALLDEVGRRRRRTRNSAACATRPTWRSASPRCRTSRPKTARAYLERVRLSSLHVEQGAARLRLGRRRAEGAASSRSCRGPSSRSRDVERRGGARGAHRGAVCLRRARRLRPVARALQRGDRRFRPREREPRRIDRRDPRRQAGRRPARAQPRRRDGLVLEHPRAARDAARAATWRRCWRSTSSRRRSRTTATCASWRRTCRAGRTTSASSTTCWRNRRQAYAERLPQVRDASRASSTSTRCSKRRDALAGELAAGRGGGRRRRLRRREAARAARAPGRACRRRCSAPGADPEVAAARDRVRLVAGALTWQLAQQYPGARCGTRRRRCARIDAELAEAQRARRRAGAGAARRAGALRRASPSASPSSTSASSVLIPRVAALSREQQQAGAGLAVAELTRQKERLAAYTTQARFAVAQLYDRANLAKEARPCAASKPPGAACSLAVPAGAVPRCAGKRSSGTPDNEPTLKTLAGRKVDGREGRRHRRPAKRRRSPPTASSSTWRRGAAARRGDAPPRRPGDGQRRQPAAPAATAATTPDYKAAIARYQDFLKDLPEGPGQRPRALPAGARPRAGRRPRDGAEDARSPGARVPEHRLPRRSAVPPRRAAVHDARLRRRPSRPTPPC